MVSHNHIVRLLSVLVRSLRKEFPEDFYKRCNYAVFGMRALLLDARVEAEIVGGDFVDFIVSKDGARRHAGLRPGPVLAFLGRRGGPADTAGEH
jgi:hypothetical protein